MPVAAVSVDDTDARLLHRLGAGDREDALAELYRRWERRLFGLGLRLLGDAGLAEELVQETFVRLWRTASRFDPERGSAPSFIFAISRRIAIDLWRRPSSRPIETEPEREASGDRVEEIVTGLAVREALDALTPEHREVIELQHFQGLRQQEVADALGIPVGTVKTRTWYALRMLKLLLKEREVS